ncbi:MAG TPA: hypothetical protein DDY98_01490 [Ruminococcaceae bacterium]|nr:hypothetical protein [Oscillospiraceae bacterium]
MYLKELNVEQKELFLDLCVNASNSNDEFDETEKNLIEQYAEEMEIEPRFEARFSTDEAAVKLKEISNETDIRAVFVELIAVLMSDHVLDVVESDFTAKVMKIFDLPTKDLDVVMKNLKKLFEVYDNLNEYVNG